MLTSEWIMKIDKEHEAAIEAWTESLFKACGTASETINVAVEGAALMFARPATAPSDLVARAVGLVGRTIGTKDAIEKWKADSAQLISDLAKAEPVAKAERDGFWAQFYAECCEAMGLDQDLPDAARKGFNPKMIADLREQLEAAKDHLDMATAENARVRIAHGELEERAEKAEASGDATAPSDLVARARDLVELIGANPAMRWGADTLDIIHDLAKAEPVDEAKPSHEPDDGPLRAFSVEDCGHRYDDALADAVSELCRRALGGKR